MYITFNGTAQSPSIPDSLKESIVAAYEEGRPFDRVYVATSGDSKETQIEAQNTLGFIPEGGGEYVVTDPEVVADCEGWASNL